MICGDAGGVVKRPEGPNTGTMPRRRAGRSESPPPTKAMPQSGDNPGRARARWLLCAAVVAGLAVGVRLLRPQDSTAQVRSQAEPRVEAQANREAPIGTVDLSELCLPLIDIQPERGLCYTARIPLLTPNERDDRVTGLRLFEDEIELTQSARPHAEIRELGDGRFSHWGPTLYFSSTDGSDPISNGRRYTVVFDRDSRVDRRQSPFTPIQVIDVVSIRRGKGHEWVVSLPPALAALPCDSQALNASRILLLEAGWPLPMPHSLRKDVIERGEGRFVHTGSVVHFSTTDNSDPRSNGRTYVLAVADEPDHRFVDPCGGSPPKVVESLPPPSIEWPGEGEVITDARPTIRVADPDPDLLYYWELDTVETFDSPNLHARPRTSLTAQGRNLLRVLDREPDFSPEFTPPYRLGVLADHDIRRGEAGYTELIAQRLACGLPRGENQLREVYEFVHHQFYPIDADANIRDPLETWRRDRGYCISVNYLTSRLLAELGYPTRRVELSVPALTSESEGPFSSHSALEAHDGRGWSIIDPWFGYYFYGVSFQELAAAPGTESWPAMEFVKPGGDQATPEGWRMLYYDEYARARRYDAFTGELIVSDMQSEPFLFTTPIEPVRMPEPSALWPMSSLQIHVRVRSVKTSARSVQSWPIPSATIGVQRESVVHVSSWTVLSFRIDVIRSCGR